MSAKPEGSNQVRRVCEILCLLAQGDVVAGMAPGDIARALHIDPSATVRTLAELMRNEFVEKLDSGRYRLGVALPRIGTNFGLAIDRTLIHATELKQRYTRIL